jgi:hypothetical protein
MSDAGGSQFDVISVGKTDVTIAVDDVIPAEVRTELDALDDVGVESGGSFRGVGEVALDVANLALAGVVGGASWALIPHTAAFLRGVSRRNQADGALTVEQVGEVILRVADAVHGRHVPAEIIAARRDIDGSWDCQVIVAGAPVTARVHPSGHLVAWMAGDFTARQQPIEE